MSKQVNHVNIEPEILHGNWSSYIIFLLTLLFLVKLTLSFHYNADHTYTMQELVKEVTSKTIVTMDWQFCIELIKLSP